MRSTILLVIAIPIFAFSQNNVDGIYMEMEERRCSYNSIEMINTKKTVCISDRPIIMLSDFKEISPLVSQKGRSLRGFFITLSEKGRKKLEAVSKILSKQNLVLITNNQAVCLMKVHGVITSGKVVVAEDSGHSSLKSIHQKIKEQIEQ